MASYGSRIASSLIVSAIALTATAENVGRHGDDPPVSPRSKFVRKLWAEPVPTEVSRLFYLRAVVAIAGDPEGLARLDRFIEHAALLKLAGLPRPEGATIEEAVRKLDTNDERERPLRMQVLDRSLVASPHELSAGEPTVPDKHLRVDLSNTSSMSIRGFATALRVRPRGSAYWVDSYCTDTKPRAPAQRWISDCVAAFGAHAVYPGDAAFQAMIRDAVAHWKSGTAEVVIEPHGITFTENVHPVSEFTVMQQRSAPGMDAVDLRESREARTMAVDQLRIATCEERGVCGSESLSRTFNANPFAITMLGAFVAGLVLALPVVILSRRRSAIVAASLSVCAIAGVAAVLGSGVLGWGILVLGPLLVVAAPAAIVGLWLGVVVLRTFFGGAGRDREDVAA